MISISDLESVVFGPAASASPGNILEMQILRLPPRPGTLRGGPQQAFQLILMYLQVWEPLVYRKIYYSIWNGKCFVKKKK